MSDPKEKLSLLSQMIALVRSDDHLDPREYDFLVLLAERMDVGEYTLKSMLEGPAEPLTLPETEAERILQFHTLVLLMNVDEEQHPAEVLTIKNMGLRMGLSPYAMERIFRIMPGYPNRIVPPDVVIDIFRSYYN